MSNLTLIFIIVPIIAGLLLFINLIFAVHKPDFEKISPFECGFSGFKEQTRSPFSIKFYLVGLLFLIFDLEIALIYPFLVTNINIFALVIVITFLIILTIGFYYEWKKGALILKN